MRDSECVRFLKSVLPGLGLRWSGYRRVHRTVCKRLRRRLRALHLEDLEAYRARLCADPQEQRELDALCRIPISRFGRDRAVFEALRTEVLPALAEACGRRGAPALKAWSCGCASGEEAYSLGILWHGDLHAGSPAVRLRILASDADPHLLERARRGCYPQGSLREVPDELRARAFVPVDGLFCVRKSFRDGIEFRQEDVRVRMPAGRFDLILCRNLVFTYFEQALQAMLLERLIARLRPGGCLVIGRNECLPAGAGLTPWRPALPVYRRGA